MSDGERCRHWDTDFEKTDLCGCRNRKDKRDEEDETDFIEECDADDKTCQADGPLNLFPTEHIDEGHGDALCTTALCHQLAQYRAERDDDRETAERSAESLLNHGDDLGDGQPFGIADDTRNDEQRDEAVQLHADDEEEQQQDAHCKNNERHRISPLS